MLNRILPAVVLGICCMLTTNSDVFADCGCGAPVADCGCGAPVADCGCCDATPCCCPQRTKKFEKVTYQKEVCRLRRVCVTDECGCTKSKLQRVPVCVTRTKCVRVCDPCKPKRCCRKAKACCDCPPADCCCN